MSPVANPVDKDYNQTAIQYWLYTLYYKTRVAQDWVEPNNGLNLGFV
jgi:hypothetical protein